MVWKRRGKTWCQEFDIYVRLFSHSSKIRHSRRREGVQLKQHNDKYMHYFILMWKASLELPELGASSRNATEVFVTLRPTQSSKWTWRLSYSSKKCTLTETNKRDEHGEKWALSDTCNIPGKYHWKSHKKKSLIDEGWQRSNSQQAQVHRVHGRDTQSPS